MDALIVTCCDWPEQAILWFAAHFIISFILAMNTMEQYVDITLLRSKLALDIHNVLMKCKESMTDTAKEIGFRIHFNATKDLVAVLRSTKYPCMMQAFKDTYIDTIHYDLIRQGIWCRKRYNFDYETQSFVHSSTNSKRVNRYLEDFNIISTVVPETINVKELMPHASYSCMRHSFTTKFGCMRLEEVSFAPHIAYLFATAIVEDCSKFADFCKRCPEIRFGLTFAPVASKVIEAIKYIRGEKLPKIAEPLWTALLESGAVPPGLDWSADICRFNPLISGFPVSPDDDFWKRKGHMMLSPEEIEGGQ